MHQPFVDLQRAHVTLVEQRVAADLDVVGTGGRIGEDAVGLEDADHALAFAEHHIQTLLQQLDGLRRGEILRLVAQVTAIGNVVQVVGEHQAEVGQGWVAGMESVGRRAVELLGDHSEVRRTTRLEHADDHAVFLAHAPHDLPDRVELAELTGDVALDVLEFLLLRTGVEGQRTAFVVGAVDLGQLAALGGEERLAGRVVPLHRVQHAHRRLRLDDAVGQPAYDGLILVQIVTAVHQSLFTDAPYP